MMPGDRDCTNRCLALRDWPAPDRRAWQAMLRPGDILEGDAGIAAAWSQATRHKNRRGYGRWLDFLLQSGRFRDVADQTDRVTRDAVRAYVAHLEASCALYTIYTRIAELHAVVRAMAPERDWTWLQRAAQRLLRHAAEAAAPKRVRSSAEIYRWALARLQTVENEVPPSGTFAPLLQALRYRDALIIALLAARPIRLRNLAMIAIERHLLRTSEGYLLRFAAVETKTRRPLEFPLPAELTGRFDRYLTHYRPILLGAGDTRRLWLNRYGTALNELGLYRLVVKVTARDFGMRLNPHRFRACAATTLAIEDPGHVRITAAILGHAGLRTSEIHYNQARQLEAGRRHQAAVLALRRELCGRPERRTRRR
jgi:site-specific recombinase XerD